MTTPFIVSESEKCIAMIPIWNIEIPECKDTINIDGYEIVKNKSPEDDKEVYKECAYFIRKELIFDKSRFHTEEAFKEWADEEYTRKIISFITKLRIYLGGDVITEDFSWILLDENHESEHHHDIKPSSKKYIPDFLSLSKLEHLEDFKKFYTTLGNFEDLAGGVALTRFNSAYNRINHPELGEMLIDLIIVLESLFNKVAGDLKYKITLRTSHFLYPGRNEERHALFLFLGECYDLRNDIVHGKKYKQSELEKIEQKSVGLQRVVERVLAKALDWRNTGKLDLFRENIKEQEIDKVLINWQ